MDGIGPLRGTDRRVFASPAIWDQKAKLKRKLSQEHSEELDESEDFEESLEDDVEPEIDENPHIDLEA